MLLAGAELCLHDVSLPASCPTEPSKDLKIYTRPDRSLLCCHPQGIVQMHDLGKGVSLHVRRGVMVQPFAEQITLDGERQLEKAGRYVLMVDALEVRMHTTEFRNAMTTWFREREAASVHLLIRSRMLEMAANVANLLMGVHRAKHYYDANTWEAIGRKYVPSFASRPLSVPDEHLRSTPRR